MILPRVRVVNEIKGANAKNNLFRVKIERNVMHFTAVLAQEVFESRWKWRPWNLLWRSLFSSGHRRMEILGHETEVQAVKLFYGADSEEWRKRKAAIMIRGYGGIFRSYTVNELCSEMKRYSSKQKDFVIKNYKFFSQWKNAVSS